MRLLQLQVRFWIGKILMLGFLVCLAVSVFAQSELSIKVNSTGSKKSTGEVFQIGIKYRCASLTTAAENAVLRIPIPSNINFIAAVSSSHIEHAFYDSGSNEAVYEFKTPLDAGTSGTLGLRVQFANGSTPDGQTADFQGFFSASNAPTVSDVTTVTAQASDRLNVSKYTEGSTPVDGESIYGIRICNGDYEEIEPGTATIQNVVVTDVLPTGTTFLRNRESWGATGTYDAGSHTVTWTYPELGPGDCIWLGVDIVYPSPAYSASQYVTNVATATADVIGGATTSASDDANHELKPLTKGIDIEKKVNRASVRPSEWQYYDLEVGNTGSSTVTGLTVTDNFPAGIDVFSIELGKYSDPTASDNNFVNLDIKTSLQPTWTRVVTNESAYDDSRIDLHSYLTNKSGGELITGIRLSYGDRGQGFYAYNPPRIFLRGIRNHPPGIITNCAEVTSSDPSISSQTSCVDFELLALYPEPIPWVYAGLEDGYENPFQPGETIVFYGGVKNADGSAATLEKARMYAIVPKGLDYVPGSGKVIRSSTNEYNPSITLRENFNGNGDDLVEFVWAGSAGDLAPSQRVEVNISTVISDDLESGFPAGEVRFVASWASASIYDCWSDDYEDIHDLDQDGNASEFLCSNEVEFNVLDFMALSSTLSVKGSLDEDYSTYPATGQTLPGGLADYKLAISNDGNVSMDNIVILDILPALGDVGVIDPQGRDSKWGAKLVGPVSAESGVVVYYSTSNNPCRQGDGFLNTDPAGCDNPNWTIVPPADITSVQAIKLDFGNTLLAPGDTLEFSWPMRTPTDVLDYAASGDVAWNSAAFIGQNAVTNEVILPSEPIKTGIEIKPLVPGVVGDRVWVDQNNDGIQDVGEPGLNNVRIDLYRDNGDGIANPRVDEHVSFTLTTGDGAYLFPGLSSDDYFLVVEKLPTYEVGKPNVGADDEVDSDVSPFYFNGQIAGISDIFTITETEFDFSRDAAFAPTNKGAIGNYVWNDLDKDGTQNEGPAVGVNGVNVYLTRTNGSIVASTQTRPNGYGNPGYYLFDNIDPGTYRVRIDVPSGTVVSAQYVGSQSESDSDVNVSTGTSGNITISANETNLSIDVALQLSGTEVCDNGIDDDGDGLVDCEDGDCDSSNLCDARFLCDNTLYQTIEVSGNYWLYRVDVNPVNLVPLLNLTAAGVVGDINAIILNPKDGYIYAINVAAPFNIYRITGDLNVTNLGSAVAPSDIYYINAGAVDRNGQWIVRDGSSRRFLSIDIQNRTLNEICDFSAELPNGNVGDIEYNPVDGFYYGALDNTTTLFKYDFGTCTRSSVTMSEVISSAFGAFWISPEGMGYGYENSTGNLKQIDLQTGEVTLIGSGGGTANTDGCSCQGVSLDKDALVRTIRKGEVNTYEFTVYNRFFTTLPSSVFADDLPADATWVAGPYDLTGGLQFDTPTGIGTQSLSLRAITVPQGVSTFKVDYVVDPSYSGAHPMPNQARFEALPASIGSNIQSNDPITPALIDPTLVHFYEHCDNGVDDDVDGEIDCNDHECPSANPVIRVTPN